MGWISTDEPDEHEIEAAADEAHRMSHPYCEGCGDELCKRSEICLCGLDKAALIGPDKLPHCHGCADEASDAAAAEEPYHGEFVHSDPMHDARIRIIADGIMKLRMDGVQVTRDQAMERARNIETQLMFVPNLREG
jgi:hypothetical protein